LKEFQDGAEPAANSVSISNLFRLSEYFADQAEAYSSKARTLVQTVNDLFLQQAPHAAGTALAAARLSTGLKQVRAVLSPNDVNHCLTRSQLIVTGPPSSPQTQALLDAIRSRFIPNRVLIHVDPSDPPVGLAKDNAAVKAIIDGLKADEKPSVRVCERGTCGLPIVDVGELEKELERKDA
jgi:uncharacterized protein YyaL (SSP411 family)